MHGRAQARDPAADYEEFRAKSHRMLSYHPPLGRSVPPVSSHQIHVDVPPRPYTVEIGAGHLARLGVLLDAAGVSRTRVVVSSPVVWKLHGAAVAAALHDAQVILIPDGERHKQLSTVTRIYDALVKQQVDRGAALVGVGGGVLGDVTGFAAATYLRGIDVVHVPTTLLAQVDSAIGGKVGVNHALGKNLIGAFHQPRLVVIDPTVVSTLPRREFRAGLYEVVKYGMTSSRGLFDRVAASVPALFERRPDALLPIIAESCAIKADVVARDERESGPRRVLNFGHTAGHAIEALTKYKRFRHGEAVGYGMLVAAEVAVARGQLAASDRDRLAAIIRQLGPLPSVADLTIAEMLEAMRRDKKVVNGTLHYVLSTAIGEHAIVSDVTEDQLAEALRVVGFRSELPTGVGSSL
jgi:3-dehydroquinate synthase